MDLPSRRAAVRASWTMASSSMRAPAIQNVVWYTCAPGPPSLRSGTVKASTMVRTSFSSHSPAFQRPSIAAVQPSATTLPAAEPR